MSTVEVRALSAPERRQRRGIITMASLGAFALAIFGLLPKTGQPVTYSFVLGNEWVITKEIIAMLSPAEDIPEYESVYINTIVDSELKTLMQENNEQVLSRDLGPSMIPMHEEYGEDENGKEEAEYDNEHGESDNTSILGGAGTPVTNVGVTYYTNQVAPALLLGGTAGR